MPIWISQVCDRLMTYWLSASLVDFARVSILAVVAGWVLSRRSR